jgi:DDE_Tnp_1-associated
VGDDIEQARASGIMRYPAPYDRDGHRCLLSHHPRAQPPQPARPRQPLQETEASLLLAYLATISDPRGRRGRRHPLVAILAIAAAAVLAGARSMAAIAEWAADAPQLVRVALGARRAGPAHWVVPSEAIIRRTLARLDADAWAR